MDRLEHNRKWLAVRRVTMPFYMEAQGRVRPRSTLKGGVAWAAIEPDWRGFAFDVEEDCTQFQNDLTNSGAPWREGPPDTTKVKD